MGSLREFLIDMGRNAYGLGENVASLGSAAIAEPVAGYAAMFDPINGAQAIREGMTYQPRSEAGQMYQRGAARTLGAIAKPVMPVIDTWQRGVDIAGGYSPVAGAMLRTVPAAIGVAMGAKPALQAGRQASNTLGALQQRAIANANAPRTLNTGFRGQRGAINPSDFNLVTNPDGTVTMYHGTTKDAAQRIIQERKLISAGEPDVYMTTDPMAGYGDGTTVKFNIDPKHINLDDEFPSGRLDFRMPANKGWRIQNPEINTPKRPLTEFEQAHQLAQQRAALPVNQGGLGLPANNAAMDRARAMGFDTDVYHGTGADIDGFTKRFLKNDKKTYLYDIGIHGSLKPETANMYAEYSQYPTLARNMSAGLESGNQVVYPLLAKSGNTLDATKKLPQEIEDKILEKGDEFFKTRKRKSVQLKHIYPQDLLQELQPKMGRKPLRDFINNELGYDSVKYPFQGDNLVVTKPNQLRSRFAAFDPFNRESSNLLAQYGAVAPAATLGAYTANEKRKEKRN